MYLGSIQKLINPHFNQWKDKLSSYMVASEDQCVQKFNSFINDTLTKLRLPLSILDQLSEILIKIREGTSQLRVDYNLLPEGKKKRSPFVDPTDKIINSFVVRVQSLLISICDSCYVVLGRLPSINSIGHFFDRYMIWSLLDKLEERYKFHTAYLVCDLTPPTEPPKSIELYGEIPGVVIGGWVRRFFSSSKCSIKKKIILAMSLQNAKRGAEAVSCQKILDSAKKHQTLLTKKSHPDPERNLPEVKARLKALVNLCYRKADTEEIAVWRSPSYSACSHDLQGKNFLKDGIGGCKDGGAANVLNQWARNWIAEEHPELYSTKNGTPLNGDMFCPLKNTAVLVTETKGEIPLFTASLPVHVLNEKLFEIAMKKERNRGYYAKVLEPFKVRSITTGLAEVHHLGRLIQPFLHGALRKRAEFEFIGKRHNVEDIKKTYVGSLLLSEKVWRENGCPKLNFTAFVAGDYESATDFMHPELPEVFWETLPWVTDIDYKWVHIIRKCLEGYIINYDSLKKELGNDENRTLLHAWGRSAEELSNEIIQTWGQLMGSPVSFPVLNLVNAACFWAAVEKYLDREVRWDYVLKYFRPKFNGDDISFLSNPDFYLVWKSVCASAGLVASAGKNYMTEYFVNINSTCYWAEFEEVYDGAYRVKDFTELYVLNAGLIKGRAKVQSDSRKVVEKKNFKGMKGQPRQEDEDLLPLLDQFKEATRVCDDETLQRSRECFVGHMLPRLKRSTRWYQTPVTMGGLGLKGFDLPWSKGSMYTAFKILKSGKPSLPKTTKSRLGDASASYSKQVLDNCGLEIVGGKFIMPSCEPDETEVEEPVINEVPTFDALFLGVPDPGVQIGRPEREAEKSYIKFDLPPEVDTDEYFLQEEFLEVLNSIKCSKQGLSEKVSIRYAHEEPEVLGVFVGYRFPANQGNWQLMGGSD